MNKGVLFFAENNEKINYVKIAKTNAFLVRKYMNVGSSIVTNNESYEKDLDKFFDNVILIESSSKQKRRYAGYGHSNLLSYYNSNRAKAFDITPYDETILLDVDYLVFNDVLNLNWGSAEDVLMSRNAIDVLGNDLDVQEQRLFETTIPMYWATAVYFKKSEVAKKFFTLVKHIQKNYFYFCKFYEVRSGLYRNDYAFSIAAHIFGDFTDNGIKPISDTVLLTSTIHDKIMKVRNGNIELLAKEGNHHYPARVSQNVHLMNKYDLNSWAGEILHANQ